MVGPVEFYLLAVIRDGVLVALDGITVFRREITLVVIAGKKVIEIVKDQQLDLINGIRFILAILYPEIFLSQRRFFILFFQFA